jgi:hypothetical protein
MVSGELEGALAETIGFLFEGRCKRGKPARRFDTMPHEDIIKS